MVLDPAVVMQEGRAEPLAHRAQMGNLMRTAADIQQDDAVEAPVRQGAGRCIVAVGSE